MKVARENTIDTQPEYLTKCGKLRSVSPYFSEDSYELNARDIGSRSALPLCGRSI